MSTYVDAFDTDTRKDAPNIRVIKLKNNYLYFKRFDPHGFWRINFDKGQVPKSLQGEFTSIDEAKKTAMAYLQYKGRLDEIQPAE